MSDDLHEPGPVYRVRRSGMDAATKRLALIASGLGGALLLIVGLWSASSHRDTAIPVIEADGRPLRVKPEHPGGLQVAGANDEILSGEAGPQAEKLLPPPEAPDPLALRSEAARRPEPVPASRPAAPEPAPPAQSASATPTPAAPAPAAEPTRAAIRTKSSAGGADKVTQVQLAALASEQAALTEWQRLAKRMPDVLGGRQPAVVKAEHNGRTIWRLRTGRFDDSAEANAFCERVRSKGAGCAIASF